MTKPNITNHQLVRLLSAYWQWRWIWISSTAVFGVLAIAYALFLKSDVWVASQGMIVRDEANGAVMRLGRFESQTEMKAAQETILEMARNTQVLSDALTIVGREPSWFSWLAGESAPTPSEIETLARDCIEVRAPRGAELGTTEVIYLDVKQKSPERAKQLSIAVCEALEARLKQVRQARADGVIAELQAARATAQRNLEESTRRLQEMESQAGADLSDLRGLTDTNSGGSNNRQMLDTIKTELRQAELELQQIEIDLSLAKDSFEDPDHFLLTPGTLINSQPGLQRLREGIANASIQTGQLRGRYTANHPMVIASLEAESKIRDELRKELGLAVEALKIDREIASERINKLNKQRDQFESRLSNLALVRADYGNVNSEVRARNIQLQETESELAQAVASREAAMTSSLVTRLDEPLVGESPLGPGRGTIVLGAACCGLFFGLGVVFLITPLDANSNYGRRKLDYQGNAGRRASDAGATPAVEAESRSASPLAAGGFRGARANELQGPAPMAETGVEDQSKALMQGAMLGKRREIPGTETQALRVEAASESKESSRLPTEQEEKDEGATRAAQAVIAAALQGAGLYSVDANSPPAARSL
jgi:uncharacterized protein involved in exopolysaccharide biosynthesis